GLIGGLIAAYLVCKIEKLNFYNLLDLSAMSFLVGQGIGRWGNFTNQEVFGTNTNLPWGMWSQKTADFIMHNQADLTAKGISVEAGTFAEKAYVHPTFLYESLWCLLGFAVLYIICQKYRKFSGQIMLSYGVWYGAGRAVIEGFRLDGTPLAGIGLTLNQVRSITIAVVCAVLLVVLLRKYIKHPKPIEGVDFFPAEEETVKVSKKSKAVESALIPDQTPQTDQTADSEAAAEKADDKDAQVKTENEDQKEE
ncbi:MAG TPA: prolipoprotein diacylglyceryl transferase, partial [Clostridia bacterium]|nr:prolipoprotein diacylglyceryl transferase [Clostridia bacterium]